jgi:hypothetical protein
LQYQAGLVGDVAARSGERYQQSYKRDSNRKQGLPDSSSLTGGFGFEHKAGYSRGYYHGKYAI